MPEIRAHDTIDAETAIEGDDISDQHVALPLHKPDSTRSPRTSCVGLSNPSEEDPFTDDGYVSDGMMASFTLGQLHERLYYGQREEVR